YVVVATEPDNHVAAIGQLAEAGYTGRILVEKPFAERAVEDPSDRFEWVGVGYNLRFHPAVLALRAAVSGQRVLSVQGRVGQYLPDWRPERNYRETVTAGQAGGALPELSHELDLVAWLVGPTTVLRGWTVRSGELDIQLEDLALCVLGLPNGGLASLELNCLDRQPTRRLVVATVERTVELDLITGLVTCGDQVLHDRRVERNETFTAMHRAAMSDGQGVCSPSEAITVVRQIEQLRSGPVTEPAAGRTGSVGSWTGAYGRDGS
ncbi:MAG: hypothetical protein VX219_06920, partial [Actinomycetota bacterium]|nr:hypothetical protein [Actinomycetota bacterium]